MSRAVALLLAGSVLIFLFGIWGLIKHPSSSCRNFTESSIKINNHVITVALADTPAEQARGLSGCAEIPENSGMLFPYSPAQDATFWMKDMLIPIDIIWIRDGEVIGIEVNIQPPLPRQSFSDGGSPPDSDLPLYHSPGPITAVLELSANQAAALAIKVGSAVE